MTYNTPIVEHPFSANAKLMSVTWKEYTSFEDVAPLWADLLRRLPAPSFFQEPSIQQSWWESVGKPELHLIAILEEEQPVALFPFCKQEKTLQFLGDRDVSDYLDALILPGKETQAFVGLEQAFGTVLLWKYLDLISIPEHSPLFHGIQQLAQQRGWQYDQAQQDVCPIIELPSTWEEYLANIGKKQRHEVTRKWRKLEELGTVTFRIVTSTAEQPDALTTFFTLHKQSSLDKATFWTPEHRDFFERLSHAASLGGWLRLYFLDFNGKPAATMYCFEYGEDLLIYNSGFDAAAYAGMSIGNVLTSYTIKDAIERGKKRYDFLRGGEEYKLRYRATPHPVYDLRVEKASDPEVLSRMLQNRLG